MMISVEKYPECITKKCPRYKRELFVYKGDNNVEIGICYACGRFDGLHTDRNTLMTFVYNTEVVLDLIKNGLLIPVNNPTKTI